MSILLKNGILVDHRGIQKKDLLIKDGKIKEISNKIEICEVTEELDCSEKYILPSFVDLHVHMREPGYEYKEDLESGARAALRGGYTFINAMANTKPVCDSDEVHQFIVKKSRALDLVDLNQIVTLTKNLEGKELVNPNDFTEKPKFLSDDGRDLLSNDLMYKAMKNAYENEYGIMIHAEESVISKYDYRVAEDLVTIRDLYLAKQTGARVHFSHVSTIDSLEAIRLSKKRGVKVTCEVTPHHIFFSNYDYRVNPPIREEKDRLAVIQAIIDGTVDAIATDHAPHSSEDKEKGAPGMIGLETSFPVCYTSLVKNNHIDISKLSKIMSYNPANILGIEHGEIKEDIKANLVITDLETSYTINKDMFKSKSSNSPFIGKEVYGKVLVTIRNGKILYRGE